MKLDWPLPFTPAGQVGKDDAVEVRGNKQLMPKSTTGGRGHPYYNLAQLVKLLNVHLSGNN